MLWRMAWRNLWRHRTRTLIMASAVALTYALTLVGMGIGDDGHARMLAEAARAAGGQVLVHGHGYWASRASDAVIRQAEGVLQAARRVEGVKTAIPRVIVSGLVSTAAGSRPVLLQGVRPALEAELHSLVRDLAAGTFLTGGEDDPVVLGSRIVEKLELEVGERVVLTATGPDGEVTRALFHLTGILQTGIRELDEFVGYTTLAAAQRAVGMEGMLTQIGVLVADGTEAQVVAGRLQGALAAAPGDLEVLTWQEAVPDMVGFVEIDDAFGYLYQAVIFAVVLFSITNTFLMAVMERVREFGLLSALGVSGGRIARMLLAETALMVCLAMGTGLALGVGGHLAIDHWGINVAAYGVEELEISGVDLSDMVMHSRVNPAKWSSASALVALAVLASALYPALRASRLAPAEAMRFYE
ncbi:MAG: FtsX-like permease family protein [Candidatus Latescibacterota bacterium]